MERRLEVPSLGWVAKLADLLMMPLMYLLAGTLRDLPQCTHFWNNKKLSAKEVGVLDESLMIRVDGDSGAMNGHFAFLFHAPILGGWRNYAVIEPIDDRPWHIGWKSPLANGVSRIALSGPVRVLRGPDDTLFFGIDSETGRQISPLRIAGEGRIGVPSRFSKIKLL